MTLAKVIAGAAFASLVTLGTAAQAQTGGSQDCQPSKWGADDEIGAANHVDAEQVKMAAGLVKEGKTHPLGIVIDPNMPAFPPRGMMMQVVKQDHLEEGMGWNAAFNDDVAQLWFGIGPQLDGLGHFGQGTGDEAVYYNCNNVLDFVTLSGLTKLGIEKVPPLVGRGVLIDMAKHKGVETLEAGEGITSDDLKAAMQEQGVEVREGDVVLIHTGWTDAKLESDPEAWGSGEPGITNEAAEYLASLNPMAVGADTWGVDVAPAVEGDRVFHGHVTLIKENGIYLLETMNTGPLAEQGVNEFMFVLGQARVKGAVQMMINPVAMW